MRRRGIEGPAPCPFRDYLWLREFFGEIEKYVRAQSEARRWLYKLGAIGSARFIMLSSLS